MKVGGRVRLRPACKCEGELTGTVMTPQMMNSHLNPGKPCKPFIVL